MFNARIYQKNVKKKSISFNIDVKMLCFFLLNYKINLIFFGRRRRRLDIQERNRSI